MTDKEIMYANPLEWKLMVAKNTGNTKVTYDELNGLVETIKSQQAEIERLTTLSELGKTRANDYRVMRDRALKAEAEVERLQIRLRKVRNQFTDLSKMHSEIRAEAIKEFIEEFTSRLEDYKRHDYNTHENFVYESAIDHLVNYLKKEMAGEDK